jgi:hypothetical protein
MSFGLLGDFDALDDLDVVAEGLEASLKELRDAARERPAAKRRKKAAAKSAASSSDD